MTTYDASSAPRIRATLVAVNERANGVMQGPNASAPMANPMPAAVEME